jgi:small subunit ribosomal protein S33
MSINQAIRVCFSFHLYNRVVAGKHIADTAIHPGIIAVMSAGVPIRFSPAFKAIIHETSRKCFGNLPIVPYRTGFKLLRQKPIGPLVANHYLPETTKLFKTVAPDFMTELDERRAEALARLRRKGKGPPKKGQGKRATKKK